MKNCYKIADDTKIVAATSVGFVLYTTEKFTLLTASGIINSITKIDAIIGLKFVKLTTTIIPIIGSKICFAKLICNDSFQGIVLTFTLYK